VEDLVWVLLLLGCHVSFSCRLGEQAGDAHDPGRCGRNEVAAELGSHLGLIRVEKPRPVELERDGLPVIAFPQSNVRMVPASELLYAAVKEKRLTHANDPDLNRHLAAVVARQTERGPRLDKAKSRHEIDGAVALAMAIDRAEAPKPEPARLLGWL